MSSIIETRSDGIVMATFTVGIVSMMIQYDKYLGKKLHPIIILSRDESWRMMENEVKLKNWN